MSGKRLLLLSAVVAVAVGTLPGLLPAGPNAALDPSAFLASGQLFAGAGIVFLGGLLTALTPCVYPLIPITVGIFGARKASSRGRALLLTLAYVAGMGLVFSILGIIAAKTGQAFGSLLGDPRVAIGLAIFLLILASSMFGAFELSLPSGLVQRLNSVGGAGPGGAFLMGSVSGFLAAPCTGPVLTALLAFVAKTQNVVAGGSLLFIYALGIGVPFVLIGVFALRLPKGGAWMESVKSVLGIALVALAASYLKDALPSWREWFANIGRELGSAPGAWAAAILAAVGVLMGGIHRSFKGRPAELSLKVAGVAFVVGALLLRATALNAPSNGEVWVRLCGGPEAPSSPWRERVEGGSRRLLSTLVDAVSVKICMASVQQSHEVRWNIRFPENTASPATVVEAALQRAQSEGRPVLIDFWADWCAACKELDRETYTDQRVASEANSRFFTIKVDGTNELDQVEALYQRFGVQALPTVAFVSSSGEILNQPRVTGFVEPEKFLAELRKVR